jgi:hypothetical protein
MTHEERINFRTQHRLDFGRGDDGPICRKCGRTIYMEMLAREEICPEAAVERDAPRRDDALGIMRRHS